SLSDAFIAMPGGYGTLEELFEMLTWAQLGLHAKPIGLLNVDGFYDGLLEFVQNGKEQGFIGPQHAAYLNADADPAALMQRLKECAP
ncbi:MAG: LOG family protein, partial [Janthinobacterium sp.]